MEEHHQTEEKLNICQKCWHKSVSVWLIYMYDMWDTYQEGKIDCYWVNMEIHSHLFL